ncbi:MAG: MMPL family transporter [Bacteroidales bacterium]|nr:MMPL family transporter [Bacteroidales bacterium]
MQLSEFVVRKRFVFLIAAVVIAIACALMIPRTNINTDMTRYLPNDSPMKQGLDRMSEEFGADAVGTGMIRVMFWSLPDSLKTAAKNELSSIEGVSNLLYQDGSEEYNQGEKVLYELLCGSQRSQEDIANEIADKFGDRVIVEKSENGTMAPIGVILIAIVLLLIVLFIMCESWLEPPIFLAAIGVAVAINMGTNALLESVSVTTNSIAAILQLVLSIDYSIILMNRYRQEKSLGKGDNITAMINALKKASPSIVSSAFTTIVGLLALVFMKLKIGADMGIVLAKGVLCSLVAIYTVLPSIILAMDGAIEKSAKKVLKIKTERLAGFSMKFRIPLVVAFVVIFAGSYYLHNKTEISFSFEQKSEIEKYFPPKNITVLLYDNSDATRVIELADSMATHPNVKSFISYPSLMQKQLTATETMSMVDGLKAMAGESDFNLADFDMNMLVEAIYYIGSKNPSEEKMSLHDFASLAAGLSADTTLSAYYGISSQVGDDDLQYLDILVALTDTCLIDSLLTSQEIADLVGIDQELISLICPADQKTSIREIIRSSRELLNASMMPSPTINKTPEPQIVEQLVEIPVENDSIETLADTIHEENIAVVEEYDEDAIYKDSTIFLSQYTSSELAQMVGMNEKSASIIFTLYGRTVKHKTKTMSLYDFITFVINDIANRKMFASQINQESRRLLRHKENLMLTALQAGKTESVEEEVVEELVAELEETPVEIIEIVEEQEEEIVDATPAIDKENIEKLNMAERLMDIATKGSLFDAAEMHALLSSFGAEMELRDIELAYLYNGILHFDDDNVKMSIEDMLQTINDSVMNHPRFASLINDDIRTGMDTVNVLIDENFSQLRGSKYSQAIVFTDLPKESSATHEFVETFAAQCDQRLESEHYLIGESVMMNEMRNQFGDEMLLVSLITILSIFLIVAITFRSLAVPAILVMTVMSAVYINVTVSGLNGGKLLYLAYLIMQSILMGATIDYGILFTNNYREARATSSKIDSIRKAYLASTHTILTSGTIMTMAPFAMSVLIDDATIAKILQCIGAGALAAVVLIIFVLPGLLAAFDKFVVRKHDN